MSLLWLTKFRLIVHLLRCVTVCALRFPFIDDGRRQAYVRRWSLQFLALCGMRVRFRYADIASQPGDAGASLPISLGKDRPFKATEGGVMLVANHVSWLDIFAINAWHPAHFVAKSDIRRWPVIGWLCANTGTLFIDRESRTAVRHTLHAIAETLRQRRAVCVFPEGTTSDGTGLLPFHSNLLQAPIKIGAPLRPLALRYLDAASGEVTTAPAYIDDMSLLDSVDAILRSPPTIVELVIGAPHISNGEHRHALAKQLREAVAAMQNPPCIRTVESPSRCLGTAHRSGSSACSHET